MSERLPVGIARRKLFQAPMRNYMKTKNRLWRENGPDGINDPEDLWVTYWNRFNCIKVPVLDEDEFFDTAMAIAKVAKDKADFEERLEKANKKRQKAVMDALSGGQDLFMDLNKVLPCEDARKTMFNACKTGCLQYTLRLVQGTLHGWEADEEVLVHEDYADSEDEPDDEEDMEWLDYSEFDAAYGDPYDISFETATKRWEERKKAREAREARKAREAREACPSHVKAKRQTSTHSRGGAPVSKEDDGDSGRFHEVLSSDDEALRSERRILAPSQGDTLVSTEGRGKESSGKKKRVRFVEEAEADESAKKRQKFESSVTGNAPDLSSSPNREDANRSANRKRANDSSDESCRRKRQRTEESACASISQDSPSTRRANADMTRKRASPEDDGDVERDCKRVKIEVLESLGTHISALEDTGGVLNGPSENSPKQETSQRTVDGNASQKKVGKERKASGGVRKRQKKSPAAHAPDVASLRRGSNTRSAMRAKSLTLWELDDSGNPRMSL